MKKMTMENAARAIGGTVARALYITGERNNRVSVETKKFVDIAMSAADGFDEKYYDLLENTEKFIYTIKTLKENNYTKALKEFKEGVKWLKEHKNENIDKSFLGNYMYGFTCDIYK
ncbi:MAG: hypothetical protein HFG37_08585 [Eubacterium sp.]|nr:hypothetical protein [Eubacterium sp.]